MRNEETALALQMTSPLRGLDDHVKCRPYASAVPRKNGVLNKYFGAKINTWTLK